MKHLLSVEHLERADIERIMDRTESFAEVGRRDIKKVPTLRGRTIVNLFFESSTRTSSSFELAAKRLGHPCIVAYRRDWGLSKTDPRRRRGSGRVPARSPSAPPQRSNRA